VHRTAWPGPLEAVTLSVHDLNGNRLAEHADTGAVIREYIWLDGRPLAVIEGGQTYWLHWDHILRPVMATSSTGAVVWAARYLPFGGIDQVLVDTGVLTQNIRFPGQWFQAETGLHQNGMRDYDPTTGRYLQADPLGLVDGASVYGYARQSPVRWTDPTGLYVFPQGCAGGPVTCVGSAVVEMIIVGAIILNAPDVPDFGKSNCDDDCARLYQDVETRVNRLKKRYYDYLEDKLGLPEEGPYPPGGRRGHRNAFENDQSGLRNKLTEADSKGCRNYASDAWLWATRRI
jgi:RHS repeat-associated protein